LIEQGLTSTLAQYSYLGDSFTGQKNQPTASNWSKYQRKNATKVRKTQKK